MQISWSIEGEQQLARRLRGVSVELENWEPAFKRAANTLKDIFEGDVFNTQGRAINTRWKPLSPAYARRKAKKYPGKGILEATGDMRKSFKTLHKPDMGAVWNTATYFKYHQSNKPRRHLPRRIMMKLADSQKEIVVKIFHEHLNAKLRRV